jgi:two-component system chemotaxis response regulator CheB
VVVVLHIPRESPSALPGILDRAGPLPAVAAEQGARLRPGVVYTAPADHHVLVVDGYLRLSTGPTENGHRPAIDPLFRSAALSHGPDAIGVVLSGTRDDGTAGLAAISARGGTALVQEPDDALHAAMPANALAQVSDALVHPAAKIGPVLGELVTRPAGAVSVGDDELLLAETRIAATGTPSTDTLAGATPSAFSCPSCNGVLFELPGMPAPRFRCRVGHAWSPGALEAEHAHAVDEALWAAVRVLEEKADLVERLAKGARKHGHVRSADVFAQRAARARGQAQQVRDLVEDRWSDREQDRETTGP